MDLSWSAEQRTLRDAILEFGKRELQDDVYTRDKNGTFSRELWKKCAEIGIQGVPIPEEYGGAGLDPLTAVLALETLGYVCHDGGLCFGLNAQLWSVQMPILRFGSEAQKQKYLPRMCSGEWIGAHGMSEPGSGSDAFALSTRADACEGGYRLTGSKTFVSNAPDADFFIIFATIEREKGVLGITGFLVDRDTPGLSVGKSIEKMGLKTSPMAEVFLENCFVPTEARLGREGRAAGIFNDSMEWERGCLLASEVGTMQRQLEKCIMYARERKQFGQSISSFQSVSNRIADMKTRVDAARLMVYNAVWTKQHGAPPAVVASAASAAKLFASEALVQSSLDAVQIHGGYGFTTEYGVERELRDAVGSRLYSGTSDIQRAIIARSLGL
ncbi:MAG: acyl-CoA dehydrogenase family protein [Gemmatimonas sp.]